MNTETKFTPGPWHVPTGPFVGGLSVEVRADDYFIKCPGSGGAMSLTQTVCKLDWSKTEEWEANAHLIAAAPDLFEALDMARRYMKMCLGSSFWDGPNPHPIIDAALAKARGEVNA